MNAELRERRLRELAGAIQRRRLLAPARIVLDIAAPLGVLASQVALFAQPFAPRGRWHEYVAALSDEAGWQALRGIVEQERER